MVIAGKPIPPKRPKGAPKAAPAKSAAEKKAELARKLKDAKGNIKNRAKDLMGALKQNTSIEAFAKGVESVKHLREKIKSAPISMIEKLEDRYPGITLAAFTTRLKDKDKLNLKEWSSDAIYSKFKPNTKITIHFLGNQDAEDKWGWADMASIEWRGMTKYEGGNTSKKRVSKRRIGLKGQNKSKRGCYDNRGYMAIHTKDVVMFHDVKPAFRTEFREKVGDRYKEIDEKSYAKYAKSKYAQLDTKYFEKNKSNWTFISKRPTITPQLIREIRAKIGPLTGLTIPQRVAKVARFLAIPENNIGGRHCGDWVDRVYAIAGVRRKKGLYHSLKYALIDGDKKKGWKPKSDPGRYDVKLSGRAAYASERKLDQLQVGDWVWINNRNRYDYAGNHSGVFLGWKGDKKDRRAIIACWFGNKKGRQKITTYNLKNMPLTHISRPIEIDDSLPEGNATTDSGETKSDYIKGNESATKTAYIKTATSMAKKLCAGTNVNWRVMLGQSILETGYGTSAKARNDKNFFGIMDHKNPNRRFKLYSSMKESFEDYRNKMQVNERYQDALKYKNNPMMALAIILANGYCTDRGYFKKVMNILSKKVHGTKIGLPNTGHIDESELRNVLGNSKYVKVSDAFIDREFIRPAKAMGKYQP